MAYDAKSQTVVLFGGNKEFSDRGGELNDTWVWNGTGWKQRNPATSPPSREHASMAYDAATGTAVLFGGTSDTCGTFTDASCVKLNDTWIWNGLAKTWTQVLPPVSPAPRSEATMAYDKVSRKVVLFGGSSQSPGGLFNDTWIWDGNAQTWTAVSPPQSPGSRASAAMAPARGGKLVLFSGYEGLPTTGRVAADTWSWDGVASTWTQEITSSAPSYRVGAAMAYDAARKRTLLFSGSNRTGGGHETIADMWRWDGGVWEKVVPLSTPPLRYYASVAYDAARQQIVLFGGENRDGMRADTWVWNGTNWKQKG